MSYPHFTTNQILPFYISIVVLIISIIAFQLDKKKLALPLLFLSSIGLGYFIANLDPFLNIWDEQYHALVAKNMVESPLKPTLFQKPLLDFDYKVWAGNHVWLHKQPLFLWLMTWSIELFGVNEMAVRIPSVLLHALLVILIYRIGKITYSEKIGFYGAVFISVAYFPLELIAGKYPTDHNDTAFLFFVTASLWSWFEYQNSKKKKWIILIGLFSGCAVLTKWLVGLLVYAIWSISIGVERPSKWIQIKSYIPILASFALTIVIALPWQLYILSVYPNEAIYEFHLNTQHFFHVIEGHGGGFWFHFNALKDLYGSGDAVPFILLAGLIIYLKRSTSRIYSIAIFSAIVIVYAFYSLAATKMTPFCIIVSPFGFLSLAVLTDSGINLIQRKIKTGMFEKIIRPIILIVIAFFLINMSKIQNYHTFWKPNDNRNRIADINQMATIKKIHDSKLGDNYVVFNTDTRVNGHIAVMFYTNHTAYGFIPSESQIAKIRTQHFKVAIINTGNLPPYILNDPQIVVIN